MAQADRFTKTSGPQDRATHAEPTKRLTEAQKRPGRWRWVLGHQETGEVRILPEDARALAFCQRMGVPLDHQKLFTFSRGAESNRGTTGKRTAGLFNGFHASMVPGFHSATRSIFHVSTSPILGSQRDVQTRDASVKLS